jgi:alkylhydroperoxidase family enzyme
VRGALDDLETSGLADPERALLRFVARLNDAPASVDATEVAKLHAAGWNDEAIYDAVSVCALFNFYNRWVDGAGIHGTPEAVYHMSGKRLAQGGYTREDPGT